MSVLRSGRQLATLLLRSAPALEGTANRSQVLVSSAAGLVPSTAPACRSLAFSRSLASSTHCLQKTYLDEVAEGKEDKGADGADGSNEAAFPRASEIEGQLQAVGEKGVDAILKVVEKYGEGAEFDGKNVSQAFAHLAKAAADEGLNELHKHPRFQNLVDMALATACDMGNKELTDVVAAVGKLKFGDQMMLDTLGRRVFEKVSTLLPHELVAVVQGLQGSDHSVSKVLFDELQRRMSEVESKLTPEQKEQLKRGFKHFGY